MFRTNTGDGGSALLLKATELSPDFTPAPADALAARSCLPAACRRRALAVSGAVALLLLVAIVVAVVLATRSSGVGACAAPPANAFKLWGGRRVNASWYDFISVNVNQSFATGGGNALDVQVDWGAHYANELFANPDFQQSFDDVVRAWNPEAATRSGTVDSCGWPADPNGSPQAYKRTDCFYEDFRDGLDPARVVVALTKGCCSHDPLPSDASPYPPGDLSYRYSANIGVEAQAVEYPPGRVAQKNVLRLTAVATDNEWCPSCQYKPGGCDAWCHRSVRSNGAVQTRDLFGSGRYDVVAKVPAASGLVWAVWTFHFENHLPDGSCAGYNCYSDGFVGSARFPPATHWPRTPGSGYDRVGPCNPPGSLCEQDWATEAVVQSCARNHSGFRDPQFLGDASFGGWQTQVNHEIDIEIPANCEGTSVCGPAADPSAPPSVRNTSACVGRYHTANLNNYLWTQNSGTGPAYSNMCVSVKDRATGEPFQLIGDGRFHKYTIDWHTGGADCESRVDFYVDDIYIGTNNVFVPTRGSRLVISQWAPQPSQSHAGQPPNMVWNNFPDDWGGTPGDQRTFLQHAYVSEIRVTPYNEPRDVMYPQTSDMPDGCVPNAWVQRDPTCHSTWDGVTRIPAADPSPDHGFLSKKLSC